jgi:hypothetical protein
MIKQTPHVFKIKTTNKEGKLINKMLLFLYIRVYLPGEIHKKSSAIGMFFNI